MNCRHCRSPLSLPLVDLGSAPPSNAYVAADDLSLPERRYPLRVLICETCWLVQTEDFAHRDELFSEAYAYYSGFSSTWLAHVKRYVDDVAERFDLGPASYVVELASNDGSLLTFFRDRGIPCVGIEPTASTAAAAREKGLSIIEKFFGSDLGRELGRSRQADLVVANNVLAHVPDINDFVAGCPALLKPAGVVTFEFPHLLRLIAETQFDTIYHEHYSYLSFTTACRVLSSNGLAVFDVERIEVHGGSLRVYAQRSDLGRREKTHAVDQLLQREAAAGVSGRDYYAGFQGRAEAVRDGFAAFIAAARTAGVSVGGYGAAAKGNTLLNFAGVSADGIGFVADRNPAKVGMYLPGSRIPIVSEDELRRQRPARVVVLPWNLRSEVATQLKYIAEWGGRFVTAIPKLEVWG